MKRVLPLVAMVTVVCWCAPAVSAMALSVHHAGDDHHREAAASALAEVAAHGHHHPVATVDHEHSALRGESSRALAPPVSTVVVAVPVAGVPSPSGAAWFARAASPTESPPLFRRHCALLL